jgi:hypothetical protein
LNRPLPTASSQPRSSLKSKRRVLRELGTCVHHNAGREQNRTQTTLLIPVTELPPEPPWLPFSHGLRCWVWLPVRRGARSIKQRSRRLALFIHRRMGSGRVMMLWARKVRLKSRAHAQLAGRTPYALTTHSLTQGLLLDFPLSFMLPRLFHDALTLTLANTRIRERTKHLWPQTSEARHPTHSTCRVSHCMRTIELLQSPSGTKGNLSATAGVVVVDLSATVADSNIAATEW